MILEKNNCISKTSILIVCILTLTAFFIRIKYVNTTEIYHPVRADAYQYICYGYNIAFKATYSKDIVSAKPVPDSFRSPGYPLFIALAYKICGKKDYYPFVLYMQALLSALTVPLAFFTGIYFVNSFLSLTAGFLISICPHLISISSYFLTETLFSFFLLLSCYLFITGMGKKNIHAIFFSALCFGFSFLINETTLFIPYILSGLITINKNNRYFVSPTIPRRFLVYFLIFFTIFPAGWYLRNTLNVPETVKNNRALSTITHGTYPGFIYKSERYKYFPYKEDPEQPEFASSIHSFIFILYKRVKERPLRYLSWYLFEKPYYLWSWNILQGQGDVYIYPVKTSLYQQSVLFDNVKSLMKISHPGILCVVLLGLTVIMISFFTNKKNFYLPELTIAFLVIYYTMIYTFFASWPRYSIPLRPELYLFFVWTLSIAFSKQKSHYNSQVI